MNEELTPIEKAQLRQKELREQGIVVNRDPNQKFIDNPRPMRAIRRFCWECNGYSLSEATKCQNTNCELWLFRFGKSNPKEDELPAWRNAYAKHLKVVGEWKSADDDPDDTGEEENIEDEEE